MSKKKPILFILIIIFIAGLADLKYKGLFYRLLPNTIQSYINETL
ncbi:hypothetical protein JOC34_003832 [Virgibacillus halotolerans]|nr:hypothetical protein [Virgibacillus halotolerans]MBM7601411.1 hypothetical protein [Virgibacillus halotolerans]